ncbi:hypothetical protein COT72_00185 [archaeon CG10_big_fil_rev_8_21_14_0_10_43_11]|nr:MAG: hypothetical protein COT72_00185 [archaeon CG10_big_fil_rev_8_21_14_0_10_43_11]
MKRALFALAAIMVVGGIAFAHGYANNPTGEGNFLQDMLEHFQIMHDQPDADVDDMIAFHNEMHGNDSSLGDMIQHHRSMHGEDADFGGCPMHN